MKKRIAEAKFLVCLYLGFGLPLILLAGATHIAVSGGFA